MPPKSTWKGYLKVSLVTIPVKVPPFNTNGFPLGVDDTLVVPFTSDLALKTPETRFVLREFRR